ncbi:MAG TPA: DEAD/DEAH box helicase family protein [Phycisphaerae bacterium]|nr:DEAD/DEAH box helicase family protein [Phycisphaerae bacterium]HNU44289.1 DEAD/DEAH box helicase family protein [Phycisphaerae bacterium]
MNRRIGPLDNHSSPEDKIALFSSLFRGRDDVYPRRFESRRTGKSGYQPACANEWVRDVCEKPRVKCAECAHRRFLPVTDDVIRWHLSGQDDDGREFVMGVYPMLLDETCFFLAIDFDKAQWRDDVAAVLETCRNMDLPVALERSRSGNGGHVWFFFDEAVPAALARKLGSHVLTETMERRPEIGLDSYDRFFPNQDTLPQGGFGNLIALPLQRQARQCGNTVFLDDQLDPYADQWVFLSQTRKLERCQIEDVVRRAEGKGRIVGVRLALPDEKDAAPWAVPPSRRRKEIPIAEPLPTNLELVLGDGIYIADAGLPPALRNRLLRLAAFQNPEFYKAQAMRLPTYDKPRIIACAEEYSNHICLPRGCQDELLQLLSDVKIESVVRDERCAGSPLDAAFHGQLRPEQQAAADALLAHDTGVLSATTAFGKTVVAAWLIARRAVSTLVLVHRRQLLEQWVERLSTFLGWNRKDIGRIEGGRKKPTGTLDVALIQSVVRKGVVDDRVAAYGQLVVDECHHLPAFSFEQVARRAKAKFVIGLSATVTRKDGHHPIVFMQCGPVRYRVDAKEQAATRPFEHTVVVRPTEFRPVAAADPDARRQFHDLYDQLQNDEGRNRLICEDVVQAVRDGRSPIVLTERNRHVDCLAGMLAPQVRQLIVLRGGMRKREADAVAAQLASVPEEEERVLLATGRYIGEGFDDARLDTLFLTLPVSWRGTIAQYVGRLHRLHDRKREVRVHDYADLHVPMLARMFDRRCRGYESVGYTISLPASAVPGWPTNVPLPVDPVWKNDYAASVRRLARDGVDKPLANLFVHAAQPVLPDAEGADRARSASEAFLYRRLETLPETAGRFCLNAELPIAFDGWGRMEVDLLCQELSIAIELDGGQHLDDAEAYRRDRRKDLLLQENGYLVLRFLAEDVGKRLDAVMDAILRVLAHRRRAC